MVGCLLVLAGALGWGLIYRSTDHVVDAGFWFEPVTYGASDAMVDRLGGAITDEEMRAIASGALAEVRSAFSGLRVSVSDRQDAMYQVQVVQDLRNPMFPRGLGPAGQSRAIPGVGGRGTVNFRMLTRSAIAYAAPDAARPAIIAAIARGIGRAAVHEFAHQLLGVPRRFTKPPMSRAMNTAPRTGGSNTTGRCTGTSQVPCCESESGP